MVEKFSVLAPLNPWPISSVTDEDLQALVGGGLLHSCSYEAHPEGLTPRDEQEPTPLVGYMVSFTPFHEWGFRVPASRFMRALSHYYGVEMHNFNPNSIA
jgi:hypothetical protein